ncbi:hypothetical protein A1sIA56_06025 [Candidatus Planktophila sulfonica]|uniref:Uncharacterized protein n=1 Tax=Candidatus Planktophila sulfonica TaxID=1884904 RepID=A0A249KI27_9ACTN|nr:hypothetical protein [Candidatus Planktophila sulfonica]ASY16437.1 hypothetical protein A1sIA56_06025 [Candidatus Planktophila sulfonica]
MRRISIFLVLLLVGTTPAVAAPKSVALKKLTIVATVAGAEKLVLSGKTLVTVSNSDGPNTNILLTGMDIKGAQLWQKTIDSGADEVALTTAVDPLGNIWLAGAASSITAPESATAVIQAENPDGVVAEPTTKLRSDVNILTLWKVSALGEVLATYSSAQLAPPLINAISVNSSGVSVVGQLQDKPFLLSANNAGTFGKLLSIGTAKTQLNAVLRHGDGSISVFGSSAETLGGKKLAGVRDGVLIKVSKTGAIASVVRSSAPKADRSWIASDSTLTLTGYVKSGKVIESAFTKFTSAFAPTWTLRVPSTGSSLVQSAGSTTYGALQSNSVVSGVTGWRPTVPSLLLLSFDAKGVVTSASGSTELTEALSLAYSKDVGLVGLARTSAQSVAIFTIA